MNALSTRSNGVLGRGPLFWCLMAFLSTAAVVVLGLTDAIENKGLIIALLAIPMAMVAAVFISSYRMASAPDPACGAKGEAQKRYIKRVGVFTSLYLATFGAMSFMDQWGAVPEVIRYTLALLPGLAISGFFWAIGRLMIEEQDEFIRMLTVRQALIASALALSAASIWGFLESAVLVPHLDAYWVAVVWFFGLFVGALVNRIEHGTWGAA